MLSETISRKEKNLSQVLHEYYFKALVNQMNYEEGSVSFRKNPNIFSPDTFLRANP